MFVVAVSALALALVGAACLTSGAPTHLSWLLAMVVVAFLAAVGRPQAIGAIQYSASGIVQIAAIPLLGPVGAAVVAAVPIVVDRNEVVKRFFNLSQRVVYVLAGSFVYAALGGEVLTASSPIRPEALGVQLGLASVAAGLANGALLAVVIQLSSDGSLRAIVADLVPQVVSSYSSYAIAAYLFVVLWAPAGLGLASAVLFLPAILVIQWGLHTHAREWSTRHSLLTPFVEAVDLRHPGAAEETWLVAGAATAVATGIGLGPVEVDEVATAARLRDVGMLALDGAAPAIVRRDHPEAAARVLGSVTFLREPLELVAAHHERIDGEGYPRGLVGEGIPIGGRVLAVADTWGHLVVEGWSPADAVDHCESVVGHGLDGQCVAALRRAFERRQLPRVGAP